MGVLHYLAPHHIQPLEVSKVRPHLLWGVDDTGYKLSYDKGLHLGIEAWMGLGRQRCLFQARWRFQPYLFGLLVGYYLHQTKSQKTLRLSIPVNTVIWIIAGLLGSLCIYGIAPYSPVSGNVPSLAEVVIYNGFNCLAW